MLDLLRYGGLGLLIWGGAWFFNGGDAGVAVAGFGAGAFLMVAGYFSELRSLIPSFSSKKNDKPTAIETTLKDYERVDVESVRHLSARFSKAGDKEAVELLRKLNDHLFFLHHPGAGESNENN